MRLGDGDGPIKGRPGNKGPCMATGGDQENEEEEEREQEE